MVVVHSELILIRNSNVQLFIFVEELEELVAKDALVAALVGMDDEVFEMFDELEMDVSD